MLNGPAHTLVAAQLITNVGNGAFGTVAALYFTHVLGFSPAALALGLTVAGIAGVLAGVPAGYLADRRGARSVAATLVALTGLASAAYVVLHSYLAFVVIASLYALLDRGGYAARQALMAAVLTGSELVRARARLRVVTNVGMAVGAGLGAIALAVDRPIAYQAVLVIDALSFLCCGLLLRRLPAVAPTAVAREHTARLPVLRDRPYAVVTLLNMLLSLHIPLLEVILPLWIVGHTGAPKVLAAALVVLNTVTVVLLQVRVTARIETLDAAVRASRLAGLALLGVCLLFAASAGRSAPLATVLLVAAGALHVYGEMVQSSAGWILGYELAPADRQGQYQGLFNSGLAVNQMVAPGLLTLLLIDGGSPGWLLLGAVFLAGGYATGPVTRWARAGRPVTA